MIHQSTNLSINQLRAHLFVIYLNNFCLLLVSGNCRNTWQGRRHWN